MCLTCTALLVLVVISSLVIVRRRLPYEAWYFIHLTAYAGLVLTWFHEIPTGNEFLTNRPARYWTVLYLATLALLSRESEEDTEGRDHHLPGKLPVAVHRPTGYAVAPTRDTEGAEREHRHDKRGHDDQRDLHYVPAKGSKEGTFEVRRAGEPR